MHRLVSPAPATVASRVALPCLLIFVLTGLLAELVGAQSDPETKPPRKKPTAPTAPVVDLPPETPLAVYEGGSVTFGEYRGWLDFIKGEDEVDKRSSRIAAIAVNEVQAAKARALKLHTTEVFRIARLDFEGRLLHEELRRHLTEQVEVTPEELDLEVERRKDGFVRPKRVRLRNLLKRYPEGSDAEQIAQARKELETLRQQLVDGADFAELAGRESDSQTRYRGGMIGWITPGKLGGEIETIAFALDVGEISPVIATRDGFTILRCEEVDSAHSPPLAAIRSRVETNLRKERFAARWQDIERRVEAVVIDWDAVDSGSAKDVLFTLTLAGPGTEKENPWTVQDVRTWLQVRGQRPFEKLSEHRRTEVLRTLIEQLIAQQEARALGLGDTLNRLVHWFEISTLTATFEQQLIESRFKPLTEVEIRAFYEANRERYRRPAQRQLQVIRQSADRDTLLQAFRDMERLAKEIQAGELAFEDAARRASDHPSAARGGHLGWVSQTQVSGGLGPNVLKALEGMAIGQSSGLVQQPEGMSGDQRLWIVRLLGEREAKILDFKEASEAARNGLGNQRTRALQSQIRREVLSQLDLRVAGPDGATDVAKPD